MVDFLTEGAAAGQCWSRTRRRCSAAPADAPDGHEEEVLQRMNLSGYDIPYES